MPRASLILVRVAIALVATLALATVVVFVLSEARLRRAYELPVSTQAVAGDVERGRHLATAIVLCAECHGPDFGGRVMIDAPVMRIAAPNLTSGPGGKAAALNDVAFERAVRHGVRADGTPLLLMPSDAFTALSDEDVAAIAAYVRTLPPVNRDVGPSKLLPLGRALLVAGVLEEISAERIDHERVSLEQTPTDSLGGGRYLADAAACTFCHMPSFEGRTEAFGPPGAPIPPSLKERTRLWSEADFIRAMRTGRTPDRRTLNPFMPWQHYRAMTDEELRMLWRYVVARTRPYGDDQ